VAGRHAKGLLDHIRDETFLPTRHERLLGTDDRLLNWEIDEDDWGTWRVERLCRLVDCLLYYRHAAKNDEEQRRASLAFRDVLEDRGDERYWGLFRRDGVTLRWSVDDANRYVLVRCQCS
jgi:hypothetical protein